MTNKIDPRIPNTSTTWQLWHADKFDRDSPPSLEASGENIIHGLFELWLHTLTEGIQDNGSATFSYFQLTWGKTASTRVDANVQPFNNSSLLKLRQWAKLTSKDQVDNFIIIKIIKNFKRKMIIQRLAKLHYAILINSDRWTTSSINWSEEAKELLKRVDRMINPIQL